MWTALICWRSLKKMVLSRLWTIRKTGGVGVQRYTMNEKASNPSVINVLCKLHPPVHAATQSSFIQLMWTTFLLQRILDY
jgi:hypothetical protein